MLRFLWHFNKWNTNSVEDFQPMMPSLSVNWLENQTAFLLANQNHEGSAA